MPTNDATDLLEVLACDIQARPRGAPGIDDLTGCIRSARRESGAIVVEFDSAAADLVTAFVEAERQCCAEIGWNLSQTPQLALRITATPAQMDAIESLFPGA